MELVQPSEQPAAASDNAVPKPAPHPSPETTTFLHLLVLLHLIDKGLYTDASNCATALIKRIQPLNRRTLNPLVSKAYFYYARAFELGKHGSDIRPILLAAYRTASLRHDDETQATVLNLLLRNYLECNMVDQAEKLVANSTIKEATISNNQYARYLYYQGRIKCVQLEYTASYNCLLQAIRKAPQVAARGFRLTAYKMLCIVQLLMGEIPEKSIFRQQGIKLALRPYFELTNAVNFGNLIEFQRVVGAYAETFTRDKTISLIARLRHNVIKTGLRKINLSYSRISFADICSKLRLDSPADAEFIVAKAIRDGVIDAVIDHAGGFVQSKQQTDTYATAEPLDGLHKRIEFCLSIHNEAVRAMRYAPGAGKPDYQSEEARRERQKAEAEIANSLESDDIDDF
jgi:26S proteasome regulatory subunit N3